MTTPSRYAARGVSAGKKDVHEATKGLDKGLFPNAFCKVLPDHAGGDESLCNIMHADTAGTKPALAYLWWKETGDDSVWKGIVQDALVMNLDDLICVGATGSIILSSTIGRNRNLIPAGVVSKLIEGTAELIAELNALGTDIHLAGGETADVGDVVRTLDVGFTAFSRMKRSDVVVNAMKEGDVIIGLSSSGQATYEREYNSGIGSNGLTSARHDVLHRETGARYPESYDPAIPGDLVYSGSRKITDTEPETGLPVGKLLLSPTRTYAPVIREVLESHRASVHGIVHCSGGGQTKALRFLGDLTAVKDNLFPVPPVFRLIRGESGTPWREMYKVFNMGHRMELYVDEKSAGAIIGIANRFGIEAGVVGRCVAGSGPAVVITGEQGEHEYRLD